MTEKNDPRLEAALISCQDLAGLMDSTEEQVLLLDLRSFLAYNQGYIGGAINICVPKTLAKRQGFNVKNVECGISKQQDKQEFMERKGATAVLYDQNGTDKDLTSLFWKTFEALVHEGLCKSVRWLEGLFLFLLDTAYPVLTLCLLLLFLLLVVVG